MKDKKILVVLLSLLIAHAVRVLPVQAASPTPKAASDSAEIDPEAIKESIKRRIQDVIKNQADNGQRRRIAYTGTLNTITTNSITLETTQGIQQASTSADLTNYIDLSTNKTMKVEDVAIGDYVAAMGFLPDNGKVLDTRRVLVLRSPPPAPSVSVLYGTITAIDRRKSTITLENAKLSQKRVLTVSARTDYIIADAMNHQQELTFKDVEENTMALAVFTAAESNTETGKLTSLTIKSLSELTLQPTPPTASPKP